jgi:AcrR family transcriptional regulator
MPTEPTPRRRKPAGAAVMQPEVTVAIAAAVFAELAEVGYNRLTMEAVARRAGVGKTTVYRRWPSKEAMISALAADAITAVADVPDTGTIRGDLHAYLTATIGVLGHPLATKVVPALLAAAGSTPALSDALLVTARDARRERVAGLLRRGIARAELPDDLDVELALDFVIGPLFWRLIITRAPTGPDYLDRLIDMLLAACRATERNALS